MLPQKLTKNVSICCLIAGIALLLLGVVLFCQYWPEHQTKSETEVREDPIFPEEIPHCQTTECLDIKTVDLCSNLSRHYETVFQSVIQESCTLTEDGNLSLKSGRVAVCCQPKSYGNLLVSASRAEDAEFPHQVAVRSDLGLCGATIYNRRFVITAAHCLVNRTSGKITNLSSITVNVGSNFWGFARSPEFLYKVRRVIPHSEFSDLATSREWKERDANNRRLINDIALVELDRNITFGDRVRALQLAPKYFDPFKYANNAVVVGWGDTDNLEEKTWLQKSNFALRSDTRCFQLDQFTNYSVFSEQLLCLGGMLDGKWSPIDGSGDSGGPAICREENNHPVLCGVSSLGANNENCLEYWDEENCSPSLFTEVAYFFDWIQDVAGPQDEDTFHNAYLYGQTVSRKMYPYLMDIRTNDGKSSCSGTLIQPDIVLANAYCVFNGNMTLKKVTIVSWTDNSFGIKTAKTMGLLGQPAGTRRRRALINLAAQLEEMNMSDYIINDVALILLNHSVPISKQQLPRFPKSGEVFVNGTELSLNSNGDLVSRDITRLNQSDCKIRMHALGLNVGGNIFCGVEKYFGGSNCDRSYGRELFCHTEDGQAVLCGISIFRLCAFTFPYAFADVGPAAELIKAAILEMRQIG